MSQAVDVLILAAGFGTRLRPLTDSVPKPLIEVGKGTLIDCALWQVKRAGLTKVTLNLHYLGDQIQKYLGDGSSRGMDISYSKEDPILDTGGAIKRFMGTSPSRNLLIMNADSVFGTELDIPSIVKEFESLNSFAHLVVTDPGVGNPFSPVKALKRNNALHVVKFPGTTGIERLEDASEIGDYVFTGLQVISKRAASYWGLFGEVFSSTRDLYPKALAAKESITAQVFKGFWRDTGEKDRLAEVRSAVILGRVGTF